MEDYKERCESYERFMERMAVNIIQLTRKIGLVSSVPMPYQVDPQRFIEGCTGAMNHATKLELECLIIDFSNMSGITAVQNIPHFMRVVEAFGIIGIEVVMSGIKPDVALAAVDAGVCLGEVRTYNSTALALKDIYRA